MKKLLFLLLVLNISNCLASGDGTLPVIRDVKIDFLDSGPGLNIGLPSCVVLTINKKLKNEASVSKSVQLKKANLEQTINLTNKNGDIQIKLESQLLNSRRSLISIRRDLSNSEFMNELNLNNETIIQHIQVNSGGNSNCLMK
jgi:hypothetical protein